MYRDEEGLVYYDAGMMEIDLREILNLFWRRKWFIVTLVFIALLLSYFITDRMPRIYETSTLIMIKESGVDSLFSGQFSLLGASKNKSASYKALMESRMVLDKVIAELGLRDDKGELLPAKALREHISFSSTADTGLIRITVQYPDPVLARDIANKVVEVFTRENQRINNADLNSAIDFVNRQLATVQEELTKLEGELLQYKEESGLIMPSEYGATLLRRLTELESRIAENIYLILMERREELQIQEAMQTSDLVVIDPAIVNEVPVKPRKFFNMAIAVILAGMLAVFIIFLQEYLDTTVKEEKDIGRLTGLTVLGIIPDIKKKEYRQGYGVDQHG